MNTTLAFDVYGTLIDTHGVVTALQNMVGSRAQEVSQTWRDKQLEYSFRRSMMDRYQPFYTCTSDALVYTIDAMGVTVTAEQQTRLIERYQSLPAYDDVPDCLDAISQRSDICIYALSNGPLEDVEGLFDHAAIARYFEDIVSVDEIRKFKPDPLVYQHFLQRAGSAAEDSWLISSNAFDVIGASASGMNSVWVRRSKQQHMDPWGQPTHTIHSLAELAALF